MNRFVFVSFVMVALAGCSHDPAGVRISHDAPSPDVNVATRTEPVFYNGKTYQVSFSPSGDGGINLAIAGMGANQVRDANEVTLSAMHHSSCKDSQRVVLTQPAAFDGGTWRASGRCQG
jgi:hypothetical protein